MTRLNLFISVILCTTAYLATSFLLGNRPGAAPEWVGFIVGGVLFAVLFTGGMLLYRRFAGTPVRARSRHRDSESTNA
ncbi:hypothetical protein F5X71_06375 [Nocardia brasiliensis]|uniref:Uncharacterized protein n=1 Tax=Nocardia brasiliensis TaxID=37326 RepID=A0A6G9XM42_NOCBR|nr:hypothetical protein [Nocardia brasiliensis]QIS01987.1 hypothetical protein F5X71_06375 [Nocardia brasiliensis]